MLALVFGVALLLRAANVLALAGTPLYVEPHGDGRVYLDWADALRTGGLAGLFAAGEPYYQAPLYPHVLALLRATLGESLLVLRLVQAGMGAAAAALIAHAGARAFGARAGLVGGLLVALLPSAVWLDGLVQKSALAGLLLASCLALAMHDGRRARFALGLALGLLMLTRGEARLFVLVFGAMAFGQGRWRALGVLLGGLALVTLPVLLRNGLGGGEWILTTSQAGPNLFIGNRVGSNGTYAPLIAGRGDARHEAEDARRLAEEARGRALSSGEVSRYWRERALADVREDPAAAAGRIGRKALLALGRVEVADTDDLGHASESSPVLRLPLGFPLLLALALVGVALATPDQRRRTRPFLALAAAQLLALVVFYVFARYRMPLTLALAPVAGLGFVTLPALRTRPLVGALALGVGLGVPLLSGLDGQRGRAAALVNEGRILVERGELDLARMRAVEAVRLAPDHFDAHRLVALSLLRAERGSEALPALERAHELAPGDWQVRAWLGIALGEAGAFERSQRLLAGAALERPEALPIVSNAVALSLQLGRRADALALLRSRLAHEPEIGARPMRLQLAWILATAPEDELRGGDEALATLAPLGEDIDTLEVRAAALAELGRFEEATRALGRLVAARPSAAGRVAGALGRYREGRPLRSP